MTKRRFKAIPLTPIHIGTGAPISPEDYFISGHDLVRFNPRRVLAALPASERARFDNAIGANQIHEAWEIVRREACNRSETHLYRVRIGEGAEADLQRLVAHTERRGEVQPLPRNPYDGRVVIPGSAIKGAIRTAVLNRYVRDSGQRDQWVSQVRGAGNQDLKRLWQDIESGAMGLNKKLERDPFRFLTVTDAAVAPAAVRVDKVSVCKRDGATLTPRGIQIHAERLSSRADGDLRAGFPLEIGLEEERVQNGAVKAALAHVLTWDFVIGSCRYFFESRLKEEWCQFSMIYRGVVEPEWWKAPEGGFVLRVGRFCHYESLSLDGLRRNENRQTRQPLYGMGSSRTVCELANGRQAAFGWLRLEPAA